MKRRHFVKTSMGLAAASALPFGCAAATDNADAQVRPQEVLYHGRVPGYEAFRIIEPGRTIDKIESFTDGPLSIVRVTTDDGIEGYGQISTYDADISAMVMHRKLAGLVLGKDPAHIDALVDECIEANYKYPWSFVCRGLTGIETAIWDIYGQIRGEPVYRLLGGDRDALPVYGSSMRRDITPEEEARRMAALRDTHGFKAFKIRVATVNGHDGDAAPGRTEQIIPAVRQAVGDDVDLIADANSGYTPAKAIAVGRMLEDHGYEFFEEPCPYWELEWTAAVAATLDMGVSGGEQDNDLAQWRRMIEMDAIDICQPDPCYLGGIVRTVRAARMAGAAGKPVIPHSANLSMVTLFAMHIMAAIPNAGPYLEYTIEADAGINELSREAFSPLADVEDGQIRLPDGPGWGVTMNTDWLASASYQKSERAA